MYPGFISHWRRERCGDRRAAMGYGGGGRSREWEYRMAGEDDPEHDEDARQDQGGLQVALRQSLAHSQGTTIQKP